jgi:hypothetical protein
MIFPNNAAALGGTEVYPTPAESRTSLGRPHRRPGGMDSGLITETGLVTELIEQVRLFTNPPPTPPFVAACETIFAKLEAVYGQWTGWSETDAPNTIPVGRRQVMAAQLNADLGQVKDWLCSGCPVVRTVVAVGTGTGDREAISAVEERTGSVWCAGLSVQWGRSWWRGAQGERLVSR